MIGPPDRPSEAIDALARTLPRHRARAAVVAVVEQAWPLLWPPLGLAGAFVVAALLGLPPLLPPLWHAALLGALAVVEVALLARVFRGVRVPSPEELDRRLERASGLAHRPLAALSDQPVTKGADALWVAHILRAARAVRGLRSGWPHPGLAARDPWALRAALIVGLVAAIGIAGPLAPARLAAALSPRFAPGTPAAPERLQAWITPPAYTGLAPMFLAGARDAPDAPNPRPHPITIPAGSRLGLSLTGGHGAAPSLAMDGRTSTLPLLANDSYALEAPLAASGRVAVRRGGRIVGAWDLVVEPDPAPLVRFPEPPGTVRPGETPLVRLPWAVSHPYGVVSLEARLRLVGRPSAPALVVPIPLPGGAVKSASGAQFADLTAHPWAGLPVTAQLVGRDAAGREGVSPPAEFTLPERNFINPVAKALIAVRRNLSLHPDLTEQAAGELDRIAALAGVWEHDAGAYLNLRAITYLLIEQDAGDVVPEAQARLWTLALHIENGLANRTLRSLEQARQALDKALADARAAEKAGKPVDRRTLEALAKAFQKALQQHLQALAQEAKRNPLSQQFNPEMHPQATRRMQDLAGQARQRVESGDDKAAQQSMAELEKMLPMLRNKQEPMTARQRQQQQQREQGRRQLSAVGDVIRHEGALLDGAEARAPGTQDQLALPFRTQPNLPPVLGNQPQGAEPQGQPPAPNPSQAEASRQQQARARERKMQQALRMAIGEVMQRFADLTGKIPPNLGDADAAMRGAASALDQGQDGAAASEEQKAIAALQKGGQAMSQQLAHQFGQGQQPGEGQQPGGWREGEGYGQGFGDQAFGNPWGFGDSRNPLGNNSRDPLGRSTRDGTDGSADTGYVQIPDKPDPMRARDIQRELRRRDAQPGLSPAERDYIKRLLDTL